MQLHTFWQDLRYGLRGFRKDPGFAATAALTFGLGIGATTAIFTVVSGVLLRPLPFPEPDRLVSIQEDYGKGPNVFIGSPEVVEWQRHATSSRVAAYMDGFANLVGPTEAEHVECGSVTQSLFPLLGVQPVLGRNFLPEEDRPDGPAAVILSHALWQRRFQSDRSIVGKSLVLDDKSYTIAGVMPEGFQVPGEFRIPQELWMPFQLEEGRAHFKILWAIGRVQRGVSIETARAELDTIFQSLRRGRKVTSRVVIAPWQQAITGGVKTTLVIFLAAVGLVLLIACVNVANLLLSRGTGREKEMAVRRALGASTGRIVRQLLTESILMALCGGVLGLALASWGKSLLVAFLAKSLPTVPPIPLDLLVLGFNLGLAVLCGIAFGMAPALQAVRVPVNDRLKESGRGTSARGGMRNTLVVAEVALAMALLIGAGLLFHSFLRLRGMGSDTPADRILTMYLNLRGARYSSPESQSAFFQQAVESVRGVPGVQSAGLTTMFGGASTAIEGRPGTDIESAWSTVSPDYFRTMGIPLLRGRLFDGTDVREAPEVAMVSQSFAQRYFPNEECIGRRVGSLFQKKGWMTIVGVVADRRIQLEHEADPTLYTVHSQHGRTGAGEFSMTLMVRTASDPMRLDAPVRERLSAIDRTQVPTRIETLERSMAQSITPQRINMLLLVSFAMLALLLGSAGIYGVMSHTVSRRTHEIGIRMALGADRSEITALVVWRGLRLVAAGEALGLAAALLLNRTIASLLFHVAGTDPWTYGGVAGVWAVVGLAACYIPARRAVRVDPTVALRAE